MGTIEIICLKDIILIQCWGVGAGSRDFLQGAGAVKHYLVEAGVRESGLFRAGAGKRNL